jgi:oxygen-independent coproporphyrinogen III oxidase
VPQSAKGRPGVYAIQGAARRLPLIRGPKIPVTLTLATTPATPQLNLAALPAADVPGLYVHVPFCFHKCGYCDFYSITRQTPQRMEKFVDLILRESEIWSGNRGRLNIRPRTVFFGGGTPSLLPLPQMRRLLRGLHERFDFSACDEWTVEANPATVSEEYCRMLREEGVTRLSMGAQSFELAELSVLERHHNPEDVPRSLQLARAAGFSRVNIDLIYAVPGQTLESWMRSLCNAINLGTEHISCYALTYEPNTPMAVRKRLGRIISAPEDLELEMMRQTRAELAAAGYAAYEISNFSKPGEECRHNLIYWTGGNYLGVGPSAASHIQGWRWKNRPHLGEWERAVESGALPAMDVEQLSPRQRAGELAMLALRLSRGLDLADFAARTGFDAERMFESVLDRLAGAGLIRIESGAIRLSDVGLPLADGVAAEFLQAAGR